MELREGGCLILKQNSFLKNMEKKRQRQAISSFSNLQHQRNNFLNDSLLNDF